jgi:hypothetical protein
MCEWMAVASIVNYLCGSILAVAGEYRSPSLVPIPGWLRGRVLPGSGPDSWVFRGVFWVIWVVFWVLPGSVLVSEPFVFNHFLGSNAQFTLFSLQR